MRCLRCRYHTGSVSAILHGVIHNHHGETRPDEKMGRWRVGKYRLVTDLTSRQIGGLKRRAAKKRRQRDRTAR